MFYERRLMISAREKKRKHEAEESCDRSSAAAESIDSRTNQACYCSLELIINLNERLNRLDNKHRQSSPSRSSTFGIENRAQVSEQPQINERVFSSLALYLLR